ncbi:hypothetical protein NC653_031033 [Populus alba x Populus x berolinensis]|uniref:Uncharacterized protein n=1 Tax=Populus alba x Populus x berolinensis TaxID=444605 RepID=A0AAD6Q261_9ROSI|nr:hypothetical protein NC653_031033 [Populus alba x Populus x berolinensis]
MSTKPLATPWCQINIHVYANLACNEKHFGFIGDLNSSLLLLAVGTKLEHVITQLAYEVAEKHVAIEGELVVKPSDNHFWFHRPGFVHLLIHFILFQNAFEIAFFFWIWVGNDVFKCNCAIACETFQLDFLFFFPEKMGSTFKKSIFEEHVQVGLVGWAQKVKKKRGQKGSTEGSSEASSHASAGGLQLERLKRLKEANEGSTQSSSHEGSTLGNNASAPPFQLERLKGLKEANEGSAQSSSHEGSTLGNNASAPPFPREAEP